MEDNLNDINRMLKDMFTDKIAKSKEQIEQERLEKEKQSIYKRFKLDGEE